MDNNRIIAAGDGWFWGTQGVRAFRLKPLNMVFERRGLLLTKSNDPLQANRYISSR